MRKKCLFYGADGRSRTATGYAHQRTSGGTDQRTLLRVAIGVVWILHRFTGSQGKDARQGHGKRRFGQVHNLIPLLGTGHGALW